LHLRNHLRLLRCEVFKRVDYNQSPIKSRDVVMASVIPPPPPSEDETRTFSGDDDSRPHSPYNNGRMHNGDVFDEDEPTDVEDSQYSSYYGYASLAPGDMRCFCRPTSASGARDFGIRLGQWFVINKDQLFSGLNAAIISIPETISFSILAGVHPVIVLQSTWILALITSLLGGRPGTISGATGAIAVVISTLVKEQGIGYLFYAIMLAGVIQLLFGIFRLGKLIRLFPYSVITGFANSTGVAIAISLVNFFKEMNALNGTEEIEGAMSDRVPTRTLLEPVWGPASPLAFGVSMTPITNKSPWLAPEVLICMGSEAALALLVCLMLPKLTRLVPSSLVGLVMATIGEYAVVRPLGYRTGIVKDLADIQGIFPVPVFYHDKYVMPEASWETLRLVYATAIGVAAIALMESFMTLSIVDRMTHSDGNYNREALAQGLGQLVSGALGGMGGSAKIGQTIINVRNGGVTRLAGVVSSLCLLLIIFGAPEIVEYIPMGALIGVMVYVCLNTINWNSIVCILSTLFPQCLRNKLNFHSKIARSDVFIMLMMTAVTLFVDLAVAVAVGVAVALIAYTWESGLHLRVEREVTEEEDMVTYNISGPLFFGSVKILEEMIPNEMLVNEPTNVMIVLEETEVFDWSGMVCLKELHERLIMLGKAVKFSYITHTSKRIMEKSSRMWEDVHFMDAEDIDLDDEMVIVEDEEM